MKIQLAILAATLVSAAALAQETSQPAPANDIFSQLDADQSSGISAQEAQASPVVTQAFTRADANSDGILTREEFYGAFQVAQPGDTSQPQQEAPRPQSTMPSTEPQPE